MVAGLSTAIAVVAALGFVGVFEQWQVAAANEQQAKDHATQVEKERDQVQALNEQLRATQASCGTRCTHWRQSPGTGR